MQAASQVVIRVCGVDVTVTYKAIKHMRMRVARPHGDIHLSVPLHVTQSQVRDFVEPHLDWAVQAQVKVKNHSASSDPLLNGGHVRLWGQSREVRIRNGKRAAAYLDEDIIHLVAPDEGRARQALDRLYRQEMVPEVQELLRRWEPAVGHQVTEFRLRRMTSRWGSCNTGTAAITLNLALAERHPDSLEYVVLHELVHLLERGHGDAFKAHMDRLMPSWRNRRRALRDAP